MAKRIWDASTEPMLLMLIFAAIITLAVNITRYFTGGEYNFLECAGIFRGNHSFGCDYHRDRRKERQSV